MSEKHFGRNCALFQDITTIIQIKQIASTTAYKSKGLADFKGKSSEIDPQVAGFVYEKIMRFADI